MVLPILHYSAAIWGKKNYHSQEIVHTRAMRTFLGVGKKAPIPAIYGEMGWNTLEFHKKCDMIKFFLKLYNMPNHWKAKEIFIWDYKRALTGKKGWCKDVKEILTQNSLEDVFYGLHVGEAKYVIDKLKKELTEAMHNKWLQDIKAMPKLRTYCLLKHCYATEKYVTINLERNQRSSLSQIRIGTFPINIETGRHKKQPLQERVCPRCPNTVETEEHFLVNCPLYKDQRQKLFLEINSKIQVDLLELSSLERLYLLLNITKISRLVANFIQSCYHTRHQYIKDTTRDR